MSTLDRIRSTGSLRLRWRHVLRMTCLLMASASSVAQTPQTYTVIPPTWVPAVSGTDGPYELGMKFSATSPGQIDAIRFYKVPGDTCQTMPCPARIGRIWALGASAPMIEVPFSAETSSGWQTQALSSPLAISPNSVYVVTVNSIQAYGATHSELATVVANGGPISSVVDGGANGVYGPVTSPATLPTSSYLSTDYYRDVVFEPTSPGQVAPPTFSPPGGGYSTPQSVTISSATNSALIHYTTDGSVPSETAGIPYNGAISIASSTTLQAIAFASGMTDSAVTSSTYSISISKQPVINISQSTDGSLDLTPYSLGQGGLWSGPMIKPYISALRQLHPKFVRVFLQEYYHEYPNNQDPQYPGQYYFDLMDAMLTDVVKTGAIPIVNIDFKPKALYLWANNAPVPDTTVDPNDYTAWNALVAAIVQHTKDKGFGIQYWEIGNEPDAGEDGGTPYKFAACPPGATTCPPGTTPGTDNYLQYYTQTANAIRSVDPNAKIGGPALAAPGQPPGSLIRDNLIAAAGRGQVPLDFYSWHAYGNIPGNDAATLRTTLQQAGLKNTQTFLSEWNIGTDPTQDPSDVGFQPAYVLESTRQFVKTGLSMAAYYEIHDNHVDTGEFLNFMSGHGATNMASIWDGNPKYFGLFAFDSELRPAFHAFRLMSAMQGPQLQVTGTNINLNTDTNSDVEAYAVQRTGGYLDALLWNFYSTKNPVATLTLPAAASGYYKLSTLDTTRNDMQVRSHGPVVQLAANPLQVTFSPYQIYSLETNPIDLNYDDDSFGHSDSLKFTTTAGGASPEQQTVTIGYNGANPGNAFSATADVCWITLTTMSGAGNGQVIGTSVNSSNLPAGLYMGTVSISRADLPATTYRVTLSVNPVASTLATLFTNQLPSYPDYADTVAYELGLQFQATEPGHNITSIRFYKAVEETGLHTGRIWDSSGKLLETVDFTNETTSGWQQAKLHTGISMSANTTYVVSVNSNAIPNPNSNTNFNGYYAVTADAFANPIKNPPLVSFGSGGVLNTTSGQFPAVSTGSNYFRDVVLDEQ